MVYYSLGAITLRTLHSLLNCPVGRQWIHKDGQRLLLLLWISVRPRNWHKASRATNEKGSTWACSDMTVRLTTLEGVLRAKACMGRFE